MKKGLYIFLALLTAGCSSSYEVDTICSDPQSVTAHFEESSARLYIEDNRLYWHNADQISLFPCRTANVQYQYNGQTGSREAQFDRVSGSNSGNALSCNYAVYPYSTITSIASNGDISYSFSSTQEYAEDSFDPRANVMVAATEGSDCSTLQFKNAVGYLKLSLYGYDTVVKSIKIEGNNNEKLSGNATIKAAYGSVPVMTMPDDAANRITLNCGDGVEIGSTAEAATTFWITLPPTTFTKGVTLTVTDNLGNIFKKKSSTQLTITRNTIQPMEPLETAFDYKVGSVLPAWSEGYLDIHFINSGRGECGFYILPDGTTLLVDAGEVKKTYKANDTSDEAPVEQRPNKSTRPYMVYAKYIKHFIPNNATSVNWCVATHFHIDHIGASNMATETASAADGGYRKSGLLALHDEIQLFRVIDRSYPDYKEDSKTPAMDGNMAEDWKKFIKACEAREKGDSKKINGYRFKVGEEQITLRYDREKYSNFRIFNICANGYAWSKNGLTGSKSASGNQASCGFHLTYGKFDYIACGDITGTPQDLVANYFRDFIGKGNLEAFKGHHHLSHNSWESQMVTVGFNPRVIVNQNFYTHQPYPSLLSRLFGYTWDKDVFTSNCHPRYITDNSIEVKKLAGYNGHIVIRVQPGGDSFYVYMLDDTNFEYRIKSVHGPYTSK